MSVLRQHGLIQELRYGKKRSRYDGNPQAHYHIACERCGRVDDLPLALATAMNRAAAVASHYRIGGHRLEFYGVCPACHAVASERRVACARKKRSVVALRGAARR